MVASQKPQIFSRLTLFGSSKIQMEKQHTSAKEIDKLKRGRIRFQIVVLSSYYPTVLSSVSKDHGEKLDESIQAKQPSDADDRCQNAINYTDRGPQIQLADSAAITSYHRKLFQVALINRARTTKRVARGVSGREIARRAVADGSPEVGRHRRFDPLRGEKGNYTALGEPE
uniref:Uncharacterized protein n=1 Tax=Oryza punctata TaxID=4537 RepID=A0A0E0M9Z1_ORYPU